MIELLILRLVIISAVLFGIYLLYQATKPTKKDANTIDTQKLSGKDLEEYVNKLKELIKKAEDDVNSGIESATSSLQLYKDQLENINKLKNKTKDL
jgi:hypothetical protein